MIYQGTPTYYNSDFSHFGVKGMKWGVRNKRERSSGLFRRRKKSLPDVETPAKSQQAGSSSGAASTAQPRRKKVSEMSDAELQQKINRMRLEQQYSELTSKGKEMSKGAKFVKRMSSALQTSAQAAENISKIYKAFDSIFGNKSNSNSSSKKSKKSKNSDSEDNKEKKSNPEKTKKDKDDDAPEVIVEDTPKRESRKKESKKSMYDDVIDAEYWEDVTSSANDFVDIYSNIKSVALPAASKIMSLPAVSNITSSYGDTPITSLPPATGFLALPPGRDD